MKTDQSAISSRKTQKAARSFTRRTMLKTGAATGALALAGPAYITSALGAGELNILMWSDYLPDDHIAGFKDKTGITINYTGIGSNEEIINKMKATKGQGFDIVSPTNNRNLAMGSRSKLLQPVDMKRVPIDKVNPAMSKIGPTPAGISTARVRTGCRTSGAPKALAGASDQMDSRKTACRAMAMSGSRGKCRQDHGPPALDDARCRSLHGNHRRA